MIKVGNKYIGDGAPCFVAAEIGINHNGDMNLAMRTIDAAVEAGADGVKFQNYYTEDFVLNKNLEYTYNSGDKTITESQFDMFKRYELSFEQLKRLKEYCDKKGVVFFSTPTSKRGIEDLVRLNTPLLKNGSDLLVNHNVIAEMAQTSIPTIISTGMATVSEVDEAVRAFEQAGGRELIILHCISSYPTPDEEVNLKKIVSLKNAFGYPVGFSDHTFGTVAAIGSVVLGSCFIEKHFTLDKSLPGPDHHFSSDMQELKELITGIRIIEKNLGTSKLGPTASESKGRYGFRLSCALSRDMEKGEEINQSDIMFLRPASGLNPKFVDIFIGKTLTTQLKRGDFLQISDII